MTDAPQCPQRAPIDERVAPERWAALTAALWAEREAVEEVLYRLTAERLILQKAQRWLPRADEELERAAGRLRDRTDDRAQLANDLARDLGVVDTLEGVLTVAPEPWPSVLGDHRLALRVLARDLSHCAEMTRRQVRISGRAVTESLEDVRVDRDNAAMHLALGQFRSVERELLVTAADAMHRSAMITIERLLAETAEPLELFLS